MKQINNLAFNYLQQIKKAIVAHNAMFFEIGKMLKTFRDQKLYEALGYVRWMDFANSYELNVSSSTIEAYIQLYEVFIEKYQFKQDEISQIPYDKLRLIMPEINKCNDKEKVEEWVSKAKELSRSDILKLRGQMSDDGKFKNKFVILKLCEHCDGYIIPEDLQICNCVVDKKK
jgi:hypothetical protein